MTKEIKSLFSHNKFLLIIIGLIITLLVDTSVIKIYDLIDKYFIPIESKIFLFSINSFFSLILQFFIIRYANNEFKQDKWIKRINVKPFYKICLATLFGTAILVGVLIFQLTIEHSYNTLIILLIIGISYGTSSFLIIWLSVLFISWYKLNHKLIVLLYFVSMLLISINLIIISVTTSIKIIDRPTEIHEYVGGSVYISTGKNIVLDNLFNLTSLFSFISIWITTGILMEKYTDKFMKRIAYWTLLSIPLIYFLINYFQHFIVYNMLLQYLTVDPINVSIIITLFLSLSKPIGGLTFGILFWNIARIVKYEKNMRTYMIIAGLGVFLIFSANQGISLNVLPYPPFGLITITVLNVASFLILLGIYNAAVNVSANTELRKSIRQHALESNLLDLIGQAEMERELQKTVSKIVKDKDQEYDSNRMGYVDLDEEELKKYVNSILRESKKDSKSNNNI